MPSEVMSDITPGPVTPERGSSDTVGLKARASDLSKPVPWSGPCLTDFGPSDHATLLGRRYRLSASRHTSLGFWWGLIRSGLSRL